MVVVDLIPASSRPYIGGSTDNTVWDLVIGYNGFGRIFGASSSVGSQGNGASFGGEAGLYRMFNEHHGRPDLLADPLRARSPWSAGLVLRGRAPRTDAKRAALMLWGGWFVLHYLTFALAEGTFHPYYVTAMAPGIAALAGSGGVMLYRAFREGSAAVGSPRERVRAWGGRGCCRRRSRAARCGRSSCSSGSPAPGRCTRSPRSWPGSRVRSPVIGLLLGRFTGRQRLTGIAALAAVVALLAGPAAYSASAADLRHQRHQPDGRSEHRAAWAGGGGMGGGSGPVGSGGPGGGTRHAGNSGSAPSGSSTLRHGSQSTGQSGVRP